jgi:radical SAM protein with 4Fe4S-binding SPASM domain
LTALLPPGSDACVDFAKKAAGRGCIVALRLWNLGSDDDNTQILQRLHAAFPGEWGKVRGGSSLRLCDKLFLEWGERFDWPDMNAPDMGEEVFCYGLGDHFGVLCDGTVVPCCLDCEGDIPLGNIFTSPINEILSCERAVAMKNGFSRRHATEELCRKCGYARRFK